MKRNEFKNKIAEYYNKSNELENIDEKGKRSKIFLENIIKESGDLEVVMPPFSFRIYEDEEKNLAFIGNDGQVKSVREIDAFDYLSLLNTFKDVVEGKWDS